MPRGLLVTVFANLVLFGAGVATVAAVATVLVMAAQTGATRRTAP